MHELFNPTNSHKRFTGDLSLGHMNYHRGGPLIGSSLRLTGRAVLLAIVFTVILFMVVRGLGPAAITLGLMVFFLALVAAGVQAVQNGSLLASWVLALSIPVGIVSALSLGRGFAVPQAGVFQFRYLLLFGLFFGTLMYVVGIESARFLEAEPRDRGPMERLGTMGLLLILTVLFAYSGMAALFTPNL